ncbi:ROK family protein [Candidatus Azambacteria bacterium]|nr:ROK family protein [Candidatus Azambacteria bacterium]
MGATNTRLAVFDGKKMSAPRFLPTAGEFDEQIAQMRDAAFSFLPKGKKIAVAAGGVPGPLSKDKTTLVNAPNLGGWIGKPLRKKLEEILCAPVRLENDAALAGLGEAVFGAGRGKSIVGYITVSTGVGGARVVNGKIDENAMGFEPGGQIIRPDANEGNGSLGEYISGAALERRFGKKPEHIADEAVWREAARVLAVGLHNTIVHWSPDIVVLGGSVMLNKIPFDEVVLLLKARMKIFPRLPEIRKATLGDFGGLWGARALLSQKK